MSRRVPVQDLRGSDPTLLEVQLPDMLRRPLSQLAPINVLDLVELANTEARPRSLARPLDHFVQAIARQMADIPAGQPWDELVAEFESIEGSRVPLQFRTIWKAEAERRERSGEPALQLLERWDEQVPEPFEFNARKAHVQRSDPTARKRKTETGGRSRPGGSRGRSSGGGSSGKTRAAPVVDTERQAYIQDLVLEKLARASENGLGEQVLIAGLRHQAKAKYPDLLATEVTAVLRALKDHGRVRNSAGRWSLPTRF
ncbi:MAG: hypothetical protein AAGA48_31595 [Myxococcota bacterium]